MCIRTKKVGGLEGLARTLQKEYGVHKTEETAKRTIVTGGRKRLNRYVEMLCIDFPFGNREAIREYLALQKGERRLTIIEKGY